MAWSAKMRGTNPHHHILYRRCSQWHNKLQESLNFKSLPAKARPSVARAFSGQHGVNIGLFHRINERTENDIGMMIPVITVYADRSFVYHKTLPVTDLLKKAAVLKRVQASPATKGEDFKDEIRKIAEIKMSDPNAGTSIWRQHGRGSACDGHFVEG